jgi:hypothetical protein
MASISGTPYGYGEDVKKRAAGRPERMQKLRKKIRKGGKVSMHAKSGAQARGRKHGPPKGDASGSQKYKGSVSARKAGSTTGRLLGRLKKRGGFLGSAAATGAYVYSALSGTNPLAGPKMSKQAERKYGTPARAMATRHFKTIPGARSNIYKKRRMRGNRIVGR